MASSDQSEKKKRKSFFQTWEKNAPDSSKNVVLEPIYPESYDLSYTCLLIPRIPSRQITGEVAEHLPQWLKQVCASYDWNLGFITVNPDYFQWALRVLPAVPPGHFMQQIRHETSELILANFNNIKEENLPNDFWAPGYLVVLGIRPHPKEMIEQYIRLTRRQQGLHTF